MAGTDAMRDYSSSAEHFLFDDVSKRMPAP
jgi:hypothetical protein